MWYLLFQIGGLCPLGCSSMCWLVLNSWFSGPGFCSCPGFHLGLGASDCSPGLAFCFTGPWTKLLGICNTRSSPTTRAKTGRTAHVYVHLTGAHAEFRPKWSSRSCNCNGCGPIYEFSKGFPPSAATSTDIKLTTGHGQTSLTVVIHNGTESPPENLVDSNDLREARKRCRVFQTTALCKILRYCLSPYVFFMSQQGPLRYAPSQVGLWN